MAVNTSRSMNGDLHDGINDGRLKSLTPGRGGERTDDYAVTRAKMLQTQYNVVDFMRGITVSSDEGYEYGYAED